MIDILTTIRHRIGNCRATDIFSQAIFYFWELKNSTEKQHKLDVYLPNDDLFNEVLDKNYDAILVDALYEYSDLIIDIQIDDSEYEKENLEFHRECLEEIYNMSK